MTTVRPRKPCPYPKCKNMILLDSKFCYDHHKMKAHHINIGNQELKHCANGDCLKDNPQPLGNFIKRKASWDGLVARCKTCVSQANRSEKGRARSKKFRRTEKRKEYRRKWDKRNRPKIQARNAIGEEVRRGRLPSASCLICKECGHKAEHYHHESYKKEHRLNVIPLCSECHRGIHRK